MTKVKPKREPKKGSFVCLRCGHCCRGRGGVWVDETERFKISQSLGLSLTELDTNLVKSGPLWSVLTSEDGYCIFYQQGCSIQNSKPLSCRIWPFYDYPLSSEKAFKECQGLCSGLKNFDYQGFLDAYY